MREIKFRVWNIPEKYYQESFLFEEWIEKGKDLFKDCGHVIFEQFIGLVDANNNEIYEGDILEYSYKSKKEVMIVEFEALFDHAYPLSIWGYIFEEKPSEYKIIGNIHQHPHLLNKDKS